MAGGRRAGVDLSTNQRCLLQSVRTGTDSREGTRCLRHPPQHKNPTAANEMEELTCCFPCRSVAIFGWSVLHAWCLGLCG